MRTQNPEPSQRMPAAAHAAHAQTELDTNGVLSTEGLR